MSKVSGKALFGWARLLAPIILAQIPQTRAIAGKVAQGMDDAEAIKGTTGPERKTLVLDLARNALESVNAERPSGKPIDVDQALAATSSAIDTAFIVAKSIHDLHGDPDPTTATSLDLVAAGAGDRDSLNMKSGTQARGNSNPGGFAPPSPLGSGLGSGSGALQGAGGVGGAEEANTSGPPLTAPVPSGSDR